MFEIVFIQFGKILKLQHNLFDVVKRALEDHFF